MFVRLRWADAVWFINELECLRWKLTLSIQHVPARGADTIVSEFVDQWYIN